MATQGEHTIILVKARHKRFEPVQYFMPLTIEVDGIPYRRRWKKNSLTVSPGPHKVRLYYMWLRHRAGEAEISLDVSAGEIVLLSYKSRTLAAFPGQLEDVKRVDPVP